MSRTKDMSIVDYLARVCYSGWKLATPATQRSRGRTAIGGNECETGRRTFASPVLT